MSPGGTGGTAAGPRILLVAGEASGDAHAGRLCRALRRLSPACRLYGVGGPEMKAAGVHLLAEEDLGVIGVFEVIRHLSTLRRVERQLKRFLAEERPDLFVAVDYPGFNLRMCRFAADGGVPVMYYISPQVWAWGRGRVRQISRLVDRMVTILPFEKDFYREAGLAVDFVGHPLLDSLREDPGDGEALRASLRIPAGGLVLGLLPGSRRGEVARLLPVMRDAVARIRRELPDLHVLAAASSAERAFEIERLLGGIPGAVRVVTGDTRSVLRASDVVLVASGTATLEAACLETPMVVVYRLSAFSWVLGRLLVRVPHIALANLVAGSRVVPELIQHDARPPRVAEEALTLLRSPELREAMRVNLRGVRGALGEEGASERAAAIALETAGRGPKGRAA